MTVDIYTDGGARGNPGPAGIGVVILRGYVFPEPSSTAVGGVPPVGGRRVTDDVLWEHGEYIGSTTNNQAEYRALIRGLEKAKELGAVEVRCFLDSELLVKQLNREYRVRDQGLAPLFMKAWNLAQSFQRISFTHIPREKNKRADALVNRALDARASG